jgi:transcriptional regulator with XRE-family HTH domain
MPASKQAHILAVLRKNLSLKQPELAKLVGCSAATIQAIELNRLSLSPGLAGRISAATGVDLDWLRANDLNRPFPAVRALATQNKWISELIAQFKRLFAAASLTPKGADRDTLTLFIAWELSRLKSGKLTETEIAIREQAKEDVEQAWEAEQTQLNSEKANPPQSDVIDQALLDEIDEPHSQKALPAPRKAPHRARRSA